MKMPSYVKDESSYVRLDVPTARAIRATLDKHSPLVSYYYEHDAVERKSIQDRLVALYREQTVERHCCALIVEAVVVVAISIYTVYEYGLLAGIWSLVLVVVILGILCVAHILMLERDMPKIEATIRQAYPAYHQYQSSSLFRKLDSNIEICIFGGDCTPFSVLACKEVYEQWSKIDGEGELAERARAEMSDRIIEAAYGILQDVYQVPLYDDASEEVQQAFKDAMHKKHIAPLIEQLAAIAENFTVAHQEAEQMRTMEALRQREAKDAARQATHEFADEQVRQAINRHL